MIVELLISTIKIYASSKYRDDLFAKRLKERWLLRLDLYP